MTTNEARQVLGTDYHDLSSWWSDFIDPSDTVRAHHDPRVLANEALDSFAADWDAVVNDTDYSMDDILDALEVAAGEAVEEAPE